jgi:hypothetical protein
VNAVEIEEAVSKLAEVTFDAAEFPYAFLEAFGNKETTLKKLRAGETNKSDLGGILQRNHIHIKACAAGEVTNTLRALRESKATASQKAKYILATDGTEFEAENLDDGEVVACAYPKFSDHFGFFLALAGISTVKQIRENSFDIKATSRLNKLYIELLKDNPDWGKAARREDLNHFIARLIFCFFAEDTGIFHKTGVFTDTIEKMSSRDSSDTHEVISELFRSMNMKPDKRADAKIKRWADEGFPYVNGGLFSDSVEVPKFSKIARSYLLHVGHLDWTKINPDIFGSMIQAVADDDERGELGMHYTSVPNILKVLNPLFLDDLRAKLAEAGDNARKLLNLRHRIARIRVFDPACGSGNFLVIAYKEMRAIEAEINLRRNEPELKSGIPLTNFRGIELRHFSCEIARLALVIAEYQCDVLFRGQKLALAEFLPLEATNWITCGNALRVDWLSVCPPVNKGVKLRADDLFESPLDQAEIDFENEGGETYICGNPPYKGSQTQSKEQKSDLAVVFNPFGISSKQIDYVGGWFMKAAAYSQHCPAASAFVSTNSICQGRLVAILWPKIFEVGATIWFSHTSFKWSNLASYNAGVTVVIVGLSSANPKIRYLFDLDHAGKTTVRIANNITPYLTIGEDVIIKAQQKSLVGLPKMSFGNMPLDGGNLLLERDDLEKIPQEAASLIKPVVGSHDFINGSQRYCLWIRDQEVPLAKSVPFIASRLENNRLIRLQSSDAGSRKLASRPHQFRDLTEASTWSFIIPRHSSENRAYLPIGLLERRFIVNDSALAIYDSPLWNLAIIASQVHLVWVATVCGKLETRYRYSNTLGWHTFPIPSLTEQNKADLTRCAEDILLAREAHFPATIADLYDPKNMPANLQSAHERNDETLERIYIGRRFKNDTERLEKLFELYTRMTAKAESPKKSTTSSK